MGKIFDDIRRCMYDAQRVAREPSGVEVSPEYWGRLIAATEGNVVTSSPTAPDTVFGLKVVVDPKLGPNEWKLVYPPTS